MEDGTESATAAARAKTNRKRLWEMTMAFEEPLPVAST